MPLGIFGIIYLVSLEVMIKLYREKAWPLGVLAKILVDNKNGGAAKWQIYN